MCSFLVHVEPFSELFAVKCRPWVRVSSLAAAGRHWSKMTSPIGNIIMSMISCGYSIDAFRRSLPLYSRKTYFSGIEAPPSGENSFGRKRTPISYVILTFSSISSRLRVVWDSNPITMRHVISVLCDVTDRQWNIGNQSKERAWFSNCVRYLSALFSLTVWKLLTLFHWCLMADSEILPLGGLGEHSWPNQILYRSSFWINFSIAVTIWGN